MTGQQIAFDYLDSKKKLTHREVTVRKVYVEPSGYYVRGICHTAHAIRAFSAFRIVGDITDMTTGEVVPVIDWFSRALGVDPEHLPKSRRQIRTLELITQFVDGYAAGWRFAVGECFREPLDIRWTPYVNPETKQEEMRWTQGGLYGFAEGHCLYDSPRVYSLVWRDALQHINYAVQVQAATSDDINDSGNMIHGQVLFDLRVPEADRSRLRRVNVCRCSQHEFVDFLRCGVLQGQPLERLALGET